jgi:hypothetical protein
VFDDAGVVAVPALLAGQVVAAVVGVAPVVDAAGVVEPASTVESVWVWVRPASAVIAGVVFVESFVAAVVPFLVVVLAACLCAVAGAFFAACLWRWTRATGMSIFAWTAGAWVTAAAIVCGLGTEETAGVATAAW